MSRIIVIGALPESLLNFRGDLIKALLASGHDVTAMAAVAEPAVVEQLEAMGVSYRAFPVMRNGMNPMHDLRTFIALSKVFREQEADVVLSYTIKPVIWGGLALMGVSGPRFYALVTGLGFAFQDGGLLRKSLTALVSLLYKVSMYRATRVIFQNTDNLELFVSRKIITKDKCALVNGSGVDLQKFSVAPLPDTGFVFLTICRLLGEKGLREYAEAARLVKMHYPNAVFRLVGPPDPSPDGIPLEEVNEWIANGTIEYLGVAKDVRPAIADSHIFVLPSYHEGMPRTVLEAMAMGRPILTTDVPGCRETVVHGDNGFLVPKADANSLAERIIWFIEHRDQWNRMGERSRQLAEELFDVHTINRKLLQIMEL